VLSCVVAKLSTDFRRSASHDAAPKGLLQLQLLGRREVPAVYEEHVRYSGMVEASTVPAHTPANVPENADATADRTARGSQLCEHAVEIPGCEQVALAVHLVRAVERQDVVSIRACSVRDRAGLRIISWQSSICRAS